MMKEDAAEELKGLFLLRERESGVRGTGNKWARGNKRSVVGASPISQTSVLNVQYFVQNVQKGTVPNICVRPSI